MDVDDAATQDIFPFAFGLPISAQIKRRRPAAPSVGGNLLDPISVPYLDSGGDRHFHSEGRWKIVQKFYEISWINCCNRQVQDKHLNNDLKKK